MFSITQPQIIEELNSARVKGLTPCAPYTNFSLPFCKDDKVFIDHIAVRMIGFNEKVEELLEPFLPYWYLTDLLTLRKELEGVLSLQMQSPHFPLEFIFNQFFVDVDLSEHPSCPGGKTRLTLAEFKEVCV